MKKGNEDKHNQAKRAASREKCVGVLGHSHSQTASMPSIPARDSQPWASHTRAGQTHG